MSTEENKAVFRRYIEEVGSKGNLDLVDEVFASRFIDHQIDGSTKERDLKWIKQFLRRLREAFPDAHYEIEYQVAEGDKVATRWTMRATHRGEFRGIIPPTGKEIMVTGIGIFRFSEEGKVVETWDNFDQLGMMRQIGVVPLPGPSLLARIFVHQAKKLLFKVRSKRR